MIEPQPMPVQPAPPARRDERFAVTRRFARNKAALVALVVIVLITLAVLLAPLLAHADPNATDLASVLLPPSPAHLLGTDEFGRDVFARVLYGGRTALMVGVVVVAVSMAAGSLWGLTAAFYGGFVDNILMRAVDVLMAFPFLLLALMIVAGLGPGISRAMIAVAIGYVPVYARLVRAVALGIKDLDFVTAARSLGARDAAIMFRHVVPNLTSVIVVQATLNIGTAIIDVSGLSFLGLGVQPPQSDWGAMLADGQNYILQAPWLVFAPGLAILVVVLAFNLVGDGLRDALDPKSRRLI